MTDPIWILMKCDELISEGIKKFFVAVAKEDWMFDTFSDLYDSLTITHTVIFLEMGTQPIIIWMQQKFQLLYMV